MKIEQNIMNTELGRKGYLSPNLWHIKCNNPVFPIQIKEEIIGYECRKCGKKWKILFVE